MSLRWGLLSTARINEKLLAPAPGRFVAVASRSLERAQLYARSHQIPRAHGSYQALLEDESVDAVYISLPNGLHADWSVAALNAGKHVLCEKPLAAREADAERCFVAAEAAGRVLSEGFMWRHHPQVDRLQTLLAEGSIGRLLEVRAVFSFALHDAQDVRWDPALDGGALLDVGCYCVSAARLLAGEPERVAGEAVLAAGGVDIRFAGLLRFPRELTATFDCGFDGPTRGELRAVGSDGTICLSDPWHGREPVIDVRCAGEPDRRIELQREDPYRRQLEDFEAAVSASRPPLLGRVDAVAQARTLEALRSSAAHGSFAAVPAS